MPTLIPPRPTFATVSERVAWEALRDQLGPDDVLVSGLRISSRQKDHEIDLAAVLAGGGIDAQRWQVAGRDDLPVLGDFGRRVVLGQANDKALLDLDDVQALIEVLSGRGLPQRDLVGAAAERDGEVERLSAEQAVILDAARLLRRVEVRGVEVRGVEVRGVEVRGGGCARRGAQRRRKREDLAGRGTGPPAQPRRSTGRTHLLLPRPGGLAAWLQRRVATFPRKEQPAYVGTFHNLGVAWGAPSGSDDDSPSWEVELPGLMVELGARQPPGMLFDAMVIDEAQDFADLWWPAALAALRDEETGGLYVFCDEGQRVFSRFGGPPAGLVPLVLDHNLRNTRQIAASFSSLTPIRMRLGEKARQEAGPERYWDTFWDVDQVFYGHVLGFKGLERRAVVLALNEDEPGERSRERLYVGLSRARDQLVVCGDPAFVEEVAGPAVLRRLRGT